MRSKTFNFNLKLFNINNIYVVFMILLISQSCINNKRFDVEFIYNPVPVIYSVFSTDKELEVFTVWSKNPKEFIQFQPGDTIKNARIILYENSLVIGEMDYNN